MTGLIRELCLLSVAAAAISSAAPQGSVRTVMDLLCSVVLMLTALEPIASLDMSEYALSVAQYREMEKQLTINGEQINERLNRLVIEEEYETYIRDKAKDYDVDLAEVKVRLEWYSEGCWVPEAVELGYTKQGDANRGLEKHIEVQLGLPEEKQTWYLIQ